MGYVFMYIGEVFLSTDYVLNLERRDIDRIISICVVSLNVARVSTVVTVAFAGINTLNFANRKCLELTNRFKEVA